MIYRAVGNRCAVNFEDFNLSISNYKAKKILEDLGFKFLDKDLMLIAEELIKEKPQFKKLALPSEAPSVVSCSTFTKWLYGQKGIWIPHRAIQQYLFGEEIEIDNTQTGDLIFISGWNSDYYHKDPNEKVGHVGIIKNRSTIISASNRYGGLAEISLDEFMSWRIEKRALRGVRRYIPADVVTHTLLVPNQFEVESSDDIGWIIRRNM